MIDDLSIDRIIDDCAIDSLLNHRFIIESSVHCCFIEPLLQDADEDVDDKRAEQDEEA
jgi:hypothetical protein